jgi:hypothetical protein
MPRIRPFAAFLACLALLLSGVVNVAALAQPSIVQIEQVPCSHCDDCGQVPCPMPMPDCVQAHAPAPPVVPPTTVELPQAQWLALVWLLSDTTRKGLSPPPDPLPPRG